MLGIPGLYLLLVDWGGARGPLAKLAPKGRVMPARPRTFRHPSQGDAKEAKRDRDRRHDVKRRDVPWRGWYKTARWQRRREDQLKASPLCAMCEREGLVVPATVADHVVPHRGNPDLFWSGELQSLCASHHNGLKQAQERRGYSIEIGSDGWPIDPRHPSNCGAFDTTPKGKGG